jgi:hypothetical protein
MASVYSSGSPNSLSNIDTNISYANIHGFLQGLCNPFTPFPRPKTMMIFSAWRLDPN